MMFKKAFALMRIPSNPMDFIQNKIGNEAVGAEYAHMMNKRARIVEPNFLLAWWNLRKHIEEWEFSYFYALTTPIISLEVVFVIGMLLFALVAVFQDEYGGDIRLFL